MDRSETSAIAKSATLFLDKFALIILRKLQFLGTSNLPKDISSPTDTTKISTEGSLNRKVFILRGP